MRRSLTSLIGIAYLFITACGGAASTPPPKPALQALLQEQKFRPTEMYTGVDTPEDQEPLETLVNGAIKDVAALPEPLDGAAVRQRLQGMINDADSYATEDRDQVGRYAIRIWRAVGFTDQSHLFAVSDEQILATP